MGIFSFGEEIDHRQFLFGVGLEVLLVGEVFGGGAGLLLDPVVHGVLLSGARVVDGGSVDEEFQGGESLDGVFSGDGFLFSGVELGDEDVGALVVDLFAQFGIVRGHFLAVTAPGGVEFH